MEFVMEMIVILFSYALEKDTSCLHNMIVCHQINDE